MAEPSSDLLKTLAQMRLEDARALDRSGRAAAAFYLSGYAIECALKAVIAKSFREGVIPDRHFVNRVYSHHLVDLVTLANLKSALDERCRASDRFRANWSIVSGWKETCRYEIIERFMAELMLSATGDERDGVFPWLTEHW